MSVDMRRAGAYELKGGSHCCLMLHGFTGTPLQLRWIADRLHARGYSVVAPLLPGHGETIEALEASNWRMWLACARAAYADVRGRFEKVTVMGISMGGLLALILAEEYPVDGLVTMSAALRLRQRFSWAAPIVRFAVPTIRWETGEARPEDDFLSEYDAGYEGFPTERAFDLFRLKLLAERNLFAVVAPALIAQPEQDRVVNPIAAQTIFDGISSADKRLLPLKRGGHLCSLGPCREELVEGIFTLLRHIDDPKSLAL